MLFVEFRFLFFFLIVFGVHWLLRGARGRKLWLLGASYWFYGSWDWRFLSLIVFSTVVDYCVAQRMVKSRRPRAWLLVSLFSNLGLLGFFKYCNFFIESANSFLDFLGLGASMGTLEILLPVGISFYTFQTLSYTIDVYRGRMQPNRDFWDFALFVAFFPQLVAGPIIRAIDFMPQLKRHVSLGRTDLRAALVLFVVGFFKKACISDVVASHVDLYFAEPASFDLLSAWLATFLYAVQIYCDFSGYSDMAIACAAMLGYQLCVNFDHPYFSGNITVFWRRWHISLSSWLRDYLYIPLGGSRGSTIFTCRNLMLTMLLGGLWHGAGWNFVIWGGLHGTALILHRHWSARVSSESGLGRVLGWLGVPFTFWFVCLCWTFFRAETLADALVVSRALCFVGSSGAQSMLGGPWFVLPTVIALLIGLHLFSYRRRANPFWRRGPAWLFVVGLAMVTAAMLPLVEVNSKAFIYFQF